MAGSASRGAGAAQRASIPSTARRDLRCQSFCRGLASHSRPEVLSCGVSVLPAVRRGPAPALAPAWTANHRSQRRPWPQYWRWPVTFALLHGARWGAGDGCVEGSLGRPFRSSDPVALKASSRHSATRETKMRDLACKSSQRLLQRRYSGGSAQSFDRSPGGVSASIFYCHQGPALPGVDDPSSTKRMP